MKKNLAVLALFAAGLAAAVAARDAILRVAVERAAGAAIGARVSVGSLQWSLFGHTVELRDVRVTNPPGFPPGDLLRLPHVRVNYDLGSILARRPHLYRVHVRLSEAVIVRDKEGRLNVDALKVSKPDGGAGADAMPLRIDALELDLGRVIVKDLSKDKPLYEGYELGLKGRTYRDVKGGQQLVALLLVEAMKPTAIKGALVYGAATVAGVSFLPAAAVVLAAGKDSAETEVRAPFGRSFEAARAALEALGELREEDRGRGTLKASVASNDVTVRIAGSGDKRSLQVSARRLLLPNPRLAAGVLYAVEERLEPRREA